MTNATAFVVFTCPDSRYGRVSPSPPARVSRGTASVPLAAGHGARQPRENGTQARAWKSTTQLKVSPTPVAKAHAVEQPDASRHRPTQWKQPDASRQCPRSETARSGRYRQYLRGRFRANSLGFARSAILMDL